MSTVKSVDLKKGTRVLLKNGWYATLYDNLSNRATRMAEVEGFCTEIGSVYTTDIAEALVDDVWRTVEHTDKHAKAAQMRARMGF